MMMNVFDLMDFHLFAVLSNPFFWCRCYSILYRYPDDCCRELYYQIYFVDHQPAYEPKFESSEMNFNRINEWKKLFTLSFSPSFFHSFSFFLSPSFFHSFSIYFRSKSLTLIVLCCHRLVSKKSF